MPRAGVSGYYQMSRPARESRLRSIYKGLTWRVLATLTTYILAWIFTGDLEQAGKIAGFEFVLKFVIYYAHERAWQIVPRSKTNDTSA